MVALVLGGVYQAGEESQSRVDMLELDSVQNELDYSRADAMHERDLVNTNRYYTTIACEFVASRNRYANQTK